MGKRLPAGSPNPPASEMAGKRRPPSSFSFALLFQRSLPEGKGSVLGSQKGQGRKGSTGQPSGAEREAERGQAYLTRNPTARTAGGLSAGLRGRLRRLAGCQIKAETSRKVASASGCVFQLSLAVDCPQDLQGACTEIPSFKDKAGECTFLPSRASLRWVHRLTLKCPKSRVTGLQENPAKGA